MKSKILWCVVSFLLVAALVLASCAKEEVVGEEEEEEEVVGEEEEEEEVVPAVGEPQYGGTLTISRTGEGAFIPPREGWDALLAPSTYGAVEPYLEHLFTGDVARGLTGTGEHVFNHPRIPPELIIGQLAESWEMTWDPLRLIFHIKPGIYWQGVPGIMERRELTADDVVYSFLGYRANPRRGIEMMPTVWDWVDEWLITDRYTVTLELNRVYADWMDLLGMAIEITPHELVEAGIDDWHTHVGIGTGPFLLSKYDTDSLLTYVKNPDYRGTTIIDGEEYPLPFVDKLLYPLIVDEATRVAALRTATLDILMDVPWAYKDSLASSNPELRSWERETRWFFNMTLRHDIEEPRFYDIRVRQAMSMAIDRDLIIEQLYSGYGTRYNWPFHSSFGETLYTPMEQYPEAVQKQYEYDPVEAGRLLTEAGYPDGFMTEILVCNEYPMDIEITSLVKDMWADIGIETDLVLLDEASFWGYEGSGDFKNIFFSIQGYSTGISVLRYWLPDWPLNTSNWAPPEMTDLFDRLCLTSHPDEQNAIMKQMGILVVSELVNIFLPGENYFRYAWPWVKNFEGEVLAGSNSVGLHAIIWIDQDLKAEMGY